MAKDYAKFVVLSYGRTGSTYLVKEFNSRPDTVMRSELFHPSPEARDLANGIRWQDGTNSWDFVRNNLFADYPDTVRAVGFKLFYFHSRKGHEELSLWTELAADPTTHIVLLERENIFAGFVSEQRARATSVWHPKPGQTDYYSAVDLEVDLVAAARYLKANLERRSFGQAYAKGHPVFTMSYEDMLADSTRTLRRMADFLDLPSANWTPSAFLASSADSTRTRISNLDKVHALLASQHLDWMAEPFAPS